LVERMIVVVIIGTLAVIAIPNFLAMQLRSKRAELPTSLAAIRTAKLTCFARRDMFTTAACTPHRLPGRNPDEFSGTGLAAFQSLGWTADGKVRGRYQTTALPGTSLRREDVLSQADGDIDGDGIPCGSTTNRTELVVMATSNGVY
jgi:Tfp pilus assembly protein PilE